MNNKFIIFCVCAISFFAANAAWSGEAHKKHNTIIYTTNVTEVTEVTNVINSTTISRVTGIALSIAASQHNFDFGTHEWQGGISVGTFKDRNAISLGIAKRYGRMLLNASCGLEGSDIGCGAGVNWRF